MIFFTCSLISLVAYPVIYLSPKVMLQILISRKYIFRIYSRHSDLILTSLDVASRYQTVVILEALWFTTKSKGTLNVPGNTKVCCYPGLLLVF